MSIGRSYDGGRLGKLVAGIALTTTPVPSSSGGVTANGATIDRQALDRRYYSAKSFVRGRFTSTGTVNSVTAALTFQHSSDGTSWDNYSTATNASKTFGSTGATGAQAVEDVAEQPISLVGARRYIRQVMVPTFASATSGDSFGYQGTVLLTGADETPNT
jgi:hypothetical protein